MIYICNEFKNRFSYNRKTVKEKNKDKELKRITEIFSTKSFIKEHNKFFRGQKR